MEAPVRTMSLFALSLDIAKIGQLACSGFHNTILKSIFRSSRWVPSSSARFTSFEYHLVKDYLEFLIRADIEGLQLSGTSCWNENLVNMVLTKFPRNRLTSVSLKHIEYW